MRTFKFTYFDKFENVLDTKIIEAQNLKDAIRIREIAKANSRINDLKKISITAL